MEQLIPDQLEVFADEGVDLHRVIIGHLGDYRDMDRLRSIAATGVYLQFDHIGAQTLQLDRQRAKTVAQLIQEGYVAQILLSQDLCFKSRLHWFGGTGYDYLLRSFVPLLIAEGVSASIVHQMLVDNPRRALTFAV